jgi:biopolymer transport protein ExbD/biopolymer transport protein TolR
MAANVVSTSSGGGRHKRRRHAVMSEINVTPFVDVMLVLLIVFMVSAPLMTMSITVDLPDASGGSANNSDKEPLILTLKKSGGACTSQADLFLGQSPVGLTDIESKLRAIKDTGQPHANVLVNADKDVCYIEVMKTLGRLRSAGFGAALNIVPERGE